MSDLWNPIKLELSLNRLAMTAVVANVYEDPLIKEKIKEIVLTAYDEDNFPFRVLKIEIYKLACVKLKSSNLPKTLMPEAEGMAVIMAQQTVSWVYYVVRELQLDKSYLDVIYWTSIGTVDEARIFDEYWRKHGNFTGVLTKNAENNAVVPKLACMYANKDAIIFFQNAMIEEVQKSLGQIKLPEIRNEFDELMATYICHRYGPDCDESLDTEYSKEFRESGNVNIDEIIYISGGCGLAKPMKLFWKLLSDDEKEENVRDLAFKSLFGDIFSADDLWAEARFYDEIHRARGAEVLYFLINKMTLDERNSFLIQFADSLFKLFLKVWSYQEISLKILDEDWICELENDQYTIILEEVLCSNVWYVDPLKSCLRQNLIHRALRKILTIFPQRLIEKEVLENMSKIYRKFDVTILSIVINDEGLASKRDTMIEMGSDKILKLKKDGNLELLISFMEKVLTSDEERKKFIEKFKLQDNFSNFLKVYNPDFHQKVLLAKRLFNSD